jgi:RNA 2',3'-cyclic 3'-phosphodiesterase
VRLFLALTVPEVVRGALGTAVEEARERWPGLRWVAPERYHLTVAFLGTVPDRTVAEVSRAMAAVAAGHAPLRLRLAGAGRFGPRVLWASIDETPAGAVGRLGAASQQALVRAGLPVQEREVRAHLTLARAGRTRVSDPVVTTVDDRLRALPATGWEVDRLELWRSLLGGGPARYEVVDEAPLSG